MEIKIKGSMAKIITLKDEKNVNTKINIYNPELFFVKEDGEIILPIIDNGYIYIGETRIFGMKIFEKHNEKVLAMKPSMYFKVFDRGGELDTEPENFIYYNCYILANTFEYEDKNNKAIETSSSVNSLIYELKEEKKIDVEALINDIEDIFGK